MAVMFGRPGQLVGVGVDGQRTMYYEAAIRANARRGRCPHHSRFLKRRDVMHELRLVVIVTLGAVVGAIGIDILLMLLRAVFY